MKRLLCCALLIASLVSASLADLSGSYKCRTKDYIVFVKLTQSKSEITGVMQVFSYNPAFADPDTTEYELRGKVTGATISLFREDVDTSSRHIIGTAAKDLIKVSVPASDGTVAKLDLRRGTLAEHTKIWKTYVSECATRHNRLIWRAGLFAWQDGIGAREMEIERSIGSAKSRIEISQKEIEKSVLDLADCQKSLNSATEKADQQALSLTKLTEAVRKLDKEMQENWSAEVQRQFQDAKFQRDKFAEDLQKTSEELKNLTQGLTNSTRLKEKAEQELAAAKNDLNIANLELKYVLDWRKLLREAGFQKHLRQWKTDTCTRAKVISAAPVYSYPDEKANPIGKLYPPFCVDVLPLDGDWYIVRSLGTDTWWVKARYLKLL